MKRWKDEKTTCMIRWARWNIIVANSPSFSMFSMSHQFRSDDPQISSTILLYFHVIYTKEGNVRLLLSFPACIYALLCLLYPNIINPFASNDSIFRSLCCISDVQEARAQWQWTRHIDGRVYRGQALSNRHSAIPIM
jgi:hypothetical protein